MKKILFISMIIFSLFIINDKVYALPSSVTEFNVNGTNLAGSNNRYGFYDNVSSHQFKVEIVDQGLHNYYLLYLTTAGTDAINLSLSGGCGSSCFGSGSLIKKIGNLSGTPTSSGTPSVPYWVIILPYAKADCGAGSGACIITNYVTLKGNVNGFSGEIVGVDAVDDVSSIMSSSYVDNSEIINNQDKNSNNIIDNQNKNQSQTNEKLDNLNKNQQATNDYLKDNTAPSSDISSLGNVQGLLKPGPVDSLLNIPFKFLSVVTSSCSGTCTPLTGKFVFDSDLSIPCFSDLFYKNVPDVLMNFINLIPSAFILIQYFKHLYKKVDRAISMDTNSDDEWGVL